MAKQGSTLVAVFVAAFASSAGLWLLAARPAIPPDPTLEPRPALAQIDDACRLVEARPDWWRALLASERRWGAPPALSLAVIWRESGFEADARPLKRRFWGLLRGAPASSAYGYAQALDGTWGRYLKEARRPEARRDAFSDAADFVGWHLNVTRRELRLAYDEPLDHYVAYHEGQAGYRRPDWRENDALIVAARQVALRARLYESQLAGCVPDYADRHAPSDSPSPRARPRPPAQMADNDGE